MVNTSVEFEGVDLADWEHRAARVSSDPDAHPALKRALVEALEQDPASAVKDAETFYQIMLERALAQPSAEWRWRSQPTWCWVCNSHNTGLVGAAEWGIVHECLDCGDQFLVFMEQSSGPDSLSAKRYLEVGSP